MSVDNERLVYRSAERDGTASIQVDIDLAAESAVVIRDGTTVLWASPAIR